VSKTRAKITIILGAISPFGFGNMNARRPRALDPSKKRKATRGTKAKKKQQWQYSYWPFLQLFSSVLDVIDRHEQF
jgi:hypothetical protein